MVNGVAIATTLAFSAALWTAPANAQALTAAALFAAADKVVNDLKSLVTTTSVEGQRTIGSATTEINGLEDQLRRDVGTDIATPIQNLGSNVQNTANTLSYTVDRINDLITQQRGCLDLDINLFEAGLQTTVA
jgi:hypothetical protein